MGDVLFCLVIGGVIILGIPAIAVMGWCQWRDSRPDHSDGSESDEGMRRRINSAGGTEPLDTRRIDGDD